MDGRKNELTPPSLQQKLNRTFMLITGGFALIVSLVSGLVTFHEAEESLNANLQIIATLLQTGAIHESRQNVNLSDEAAIVIQCLQKACTKYLPLSYDYSNGFHTLILNDTKWRVLVFSDSTLSHFAIAQKTEFRDELAMDSSLRNFIAILLLGFLLMLIMRLIINYTFKPLHQLSNKLDQRLATDLTLLSTKEIPKEIIPFVHSINQLLQRVELILTQQKRFVSDAAHELRSPLTALSLLAENMQFAKDKTQLKQRLLPLQTAIERMRILLDQLLSLARMQGKPPAKPQEVDVQVLLKETIANLYPLAEAKSIDLGIVEQHEMYLMDSEEGLSIIFYNALNNAIRYTPKNGRIDVSLLIENNAAIFQVLDSGTGIAVEHQDKVFQPFFRANNTEDGNGLGLAICLEIAKRLNGKIGLANPPQGGLLFRYQQDLAKNPFS